MDPGERICDNCGRWIERNEIRYRMGVMLTAEPGPEIDLTDTANIDDVRREIEDLIRHMERMSDAEAEDANGQVHESFEYILCPECRGEIHSMMKRKTRILGPDR